MRWVVHKSTGGTCRWIPEPVGLVGNAWLWLLRETDKLQQLQLGRFAGAPSWTLRFESLMGDPRPGEGGRWCTSSGESRRERQYRGDEASATAGKNGSWSSGK